METFICPDRRHYGDVLDVLNVGALEAFVWLTDSERVECREVWLVTELLKALLPQSQLTDLQVFACLTCQTVSEAGVADRFARGKKSQNSVQLSAGKWEHTFHLGNLTGHMFHQAESFYFDFAGAGTAPKDQKVLAWNRRKGRLTWDVDWHL